MKLLAAFVPFLASFLSPVRALFVRLLGGVLDPPAQNGVKLRVDLATLRMYFQADQVLASWERAARRMLGLDEQNDTVWLEWSESDNAPAYAMRVYGRSSNGLPMTIGRLVWERVGLSQTYQARMTDGSQ